MFNIKHLRAFLAVAETLHFRRAARQIGLSQPALSRSVQQLEADVGAELFSRSRRGVALTPAGLAFQVRARRILTEVEAAAEDARRAARGAVGRVRVVYSPLAVLAGLPNAVARFREDHPGVTLELIEGATPEQRRALSRGHADLSVSLWPPAAPGWTVTPIATQPLQAVLPANHRLASAASVSFAELVDEPTIMLPRAAEPRIWDAWVDATQQSGGTPAIAVEAAQLATVLAFVEAGVGISHIPAGIARFCPPGVRLVPHAPEIAADIGAVAPDRVLGAAVEHFVEALVAAGQASARLLR